LNLLQHDFIIVAYIFEIISCNQTMAMLDIVGLEPCLVSVLSYRMYHSLYASLFGIVPGYEITRLPNAPRWWQLFQKTIDSSTEITLTIPCLLKWATT
jgi:hypothetical protein